MIKVPVPLLTDPDLPASAKVIWLVSKLYRRPAEIQAATGFSRTTILKGQALLAARSWPKAASVSLPQELLEDPEVGAQAKVVYGLLRLRGGSGQFTYPELSATSGLDAKTIKRAVLGLAGADWLRVSQEHRLAPVVFSLGTPEGAEVERVRRRIRRAENTGEQIMREYLSVLVDDHDYEDGGYAGFLVNPFTGEPLQLDRHYKVGVAFEFNGPGHYQSDKPAELARQKARDFMKAGMCREAGIDLRVVHPEDLSLHGMRQKIGDRLPIREVQGDELIVRMLQSETRRYLETAGPWTGPIK